MSTDDDKPEAKNTVMDLLVASVNGKKKPVSLRDFERSSFADVGGDEEECEMDEEDSQRLRDLRSRLNKIYFGQ